MRYDVVMDANSDKTRSANGAQALTGRFVTSREVFDQETSKIFSRHWMCVARLEELDPDGKCLPVQLEKHRLVLVQGEREVVRAFRNFCRHRGSQLVTKDNCGSVGDRLQCPYHAWTYDRTGNLVSAPNMDGVSEFRPSDAGLIEVPCAVHSGFIWINLEPQQKLYRWLEPIRSHLNSWNVGNLRIAHEIRYTVAANWKLIFQNYSECYHCPNVHPMLNRLTPFRGSSNDLESGPLLGGPMSLSPDSQTMSNDGKFVAQSIRGLKEDQLRSVYYFTLFPTMFLSLHPDYVLIHRLERMDVDRTAVVCQFLFESDAVDGEGFDPDRAIKFWDLTNRQDWEVCELAQAGMSDPGYVPGPYSNLESVVAAFDRYYFHVMGTYQ